MLEPEDHSGLLTFLSGMIVIVLAGVGMSLLFDRQFRFARDGVEMRSLVRADAEEVERLGAIKSELETSLKRAESSRHAAELNALILGVAETDRRIVDLRRTIESIRAETLSVEQGFSQYRVRYRNAEWNSAIGESLGTLCVRGGREFRNAKITRVTDVGLEIRHEEGYARVQVPDLPAELRNRFQWDAARRAKAIADEIRYDEEITKVDDVAQTKPSRKVAAPRVFENKPGAEQEVTARLRNEVSNWKSRVGTLRSEHATAMSNSNSGATSVPGSLETWSARASRLGADLAKARAGLAVAREKLAMVAPGDPLLRVERKEE